VRSSAVRAACGKIIVMFADEIVNSTPLNSTLEFLIAIATPSFLISAVGSLVLSTSTRLGRVVDRVRQLEERLSELIYSDDKDSIPLYERRVEVIVDLLDKVTSRSRILQRALAAFYYGLGMFVLTSVSIAGAAIVTKYKWVPIPLGVVGILIIFYGTILMIRETRMATATVNAEMDFTWQLAREVAPRDVIVKYSRRGGNKGMKLARLKKKDVTTIPDTSQDG